MRYPRGYMGRLYGPGIYDFPDPEPLVEIEEEPEEEEENSGTREPESYGELCDRCAERRTEAKYRVLGEEFFWCWYCRDRMKNFLGVEQI